MTAGRTLLLVPPLIFTSSNGISSNWNITPKHRSIKQDVHKSSDVPLCLPRKRLTFALPDALPTRNGRPEPSVQAANGVGKKHKRYVAMGEQLFAFLNALRGTFPEEYNWS
jgi:hypothetical protein